MWSHSQVDSILSSGARGSGAPVDDGRTDKMYSIPGLLTLKVMKGPNLFIYFSILLCVFSNPSESNSFVKHKSTVCLMLHQCHIVINISEHLLSISVLISLQ